MLYTLEERLSIGRQSYDGQLTRQTAAEKYGISHWTAKDYCKLYRDTYKLPPRKTGPKIKSIAIHYRYKKLGDPFKVYSNLLLSEVNVTGPLQCIVSDMTAFWTKGVYYVALYIDLWNNEILTYGLLFFQ